MADAGKQPKQEPEQYWLCPTCSAEVVIPKNLSANMIVEMVDAHRRYSCQKMAANG